MNMLLGFLLERGFRVYVEAEVRAPPIARLRAKFNEDGAITLYEERRDRFYIDVVALMDSSSLVVGYEVKSRFEDFSSGIAWRQLQAYIESGLFDMVYVAMPSSIVSRVLDSYGHVFDELGVGVVSLDAAGEVKVIKRARHVERIGVPRLVKNESWFKHMLALKLRREGFDVCLEALIPKPLDAISLEGRLHSSLVCNRIDLVAMSPGCTPCMRACGICSDDVIGVEVKLGEKSISGRDVEKVREYARSGVLSRLYVALVDSSGMDRSWLDVEDVAGIWILKSSKSSDTFISIEEVAGSPLLSPRFCAFFLPNSLRGGVHVCDFNSMESYYIDEAIVDARDAVGWLLKRYPWLRGCRKECEAVYLGEGGRHRSLQRIRLCGSLG